MCGIIGYTGHRPGVPVVVEGLRRLEYRGYDSAGVAFGLKGGLEVIRAKGKLAALEEKLAHEPVTLATTAMGHTRWATHGEPAERNAHPHRSNDGSLAIVHNGIIENFQEIKAELLGKGYVFHSETDTEVLVNLIAFVLMGLDKRRARRDKWRISEKTLFLPAVLGGSLGAIAGMRLFHHKTKHWYFRYGLPALLAVQILLGVFLGRRLLF